jgi:hypothetical protein
MQKHKINLSSKPSHFCMLKSLIMLLAGLTISIIFSPGDCMAQGDLLITPRRVVFEGSKRSMDLNLA